jgi:hypothetical protein
MRLTVLALVLTMAMGFPMTSLAQTAPVAQAPKLMVGDTWTYKGADGAEFTLTVRQVTPTNYVMENKVGENVQTVQVGFDFSPNWFARFEWPLEVKKKWSFDTQGPPGNDATKSNNFTTASVVEAFERVTVPAGTFDAFRVKGTQCNHTQQDKCGDFLVWYAPRVKFPVKISWVTPEYWGVSERSTELLSYRVH